MWPHLHNAIPVSKALVTGLTVGELARETSCTLITAHTWHPLLANTVASHAVALRSLDATPIAVTSLKGKKNKINKTNNTKHRDNLNTLSSVYHQLGMAEEFIHHLLSDFFLTSTLCPGVSPEVFLTVRAGLSSKSITTLALTGKLRDRTYDENNSESDTAVCDVNLLIWFRSRCFVPHYTRRWQSCGGHSHKIHSPSHWPGSSGWGHSGRRSDPRHLADTGTVPWPVGKHSPNDLCTDSVQFPGSYRCTLSKS